MNLECISGIITKNLAIHIDLTNVRSWDLNTGYTSISLTKWSNAISDKINLYDFGLTGFDNGRTDTMWSGITLTPNDTKLKMYRVGYNEVINPTPEETSGVTANTRYDLYPMSASSTTGGSQNYFNLNGGYLQGLFKLHDFNYELFPWRFGKGITIETILFLHEESHGIFYTMGIRAEDKYNPFFKGELITGETTTERTRQSTNIRGVPFYLTHEDDINLRDKVIAGVNTSFDNYLDSFEEKQEYKKAFRVVENNKKTVFNQIPQIDNIRNNIISFEITEDKKIGYKYLNDDGLLVTNTSDKTIPNTGLTLVSIVFTPNYNIITQNDLLCEPRRMGTLSFFINGRQFWKINEFPEFYFTEINNEKEKQIGVPYSISWGGGTFGLKHSWHYDYQTYILYNGQNTEYINNSFFVQENPIPDDCNPTPSENYLAGLSLSANSSTFYEVDECKPDVETPETVLDVQYSGTTGGTGSSKTYFIKFNRPISVLSNRDYDVNLSLYDTGFFHDLSTSKISLIGYSFDTDISILEEVEYTKGRNRWQDINIKFRIPENVGQKFIHLGVLIESSREFNLNRPLYIRDFTYTGADILVQDERKENMFIEENFNYSFIGGIQKLRIYDVALNSSEVLHNAIIESNNNTIFLVNKGGRLIYR